MYSLNSRADRFGIVHSVLTIVALCLLGTWAGGCQGKPADQATQNINTFKQLHNELEDSRKQVGTTLAALESYTKKPELDTYNQWVSEVQSLEMQADKVRNTAAVMNDQGEAYFMTWDAELASMSNSDLKERSADQKAATQQAYHQIGAQAPQVRMAYDKFMGDMHNLQPYFERDKTAAGVAAASSLLTTANSDGAELQRQLDQELASLDRVHAMFAQMKNGA